MKNLKRRKKIKNIKRKNNKNTEYIALDKPIISESRKKFRDNIAKECKNITSKYIGFSQDDINTDDSYEDFYTISVYLKNSTPQFEENTIYIIFSDWFDIDAYKKYPSTMSKTEYSNTPEVQKWYADQEKVLNEAIKKFSKYGKVYEDGSYDEFFIYLVLNKETIDSFKDNEVIEKVINS